MPFLIRKSPPNLTPGVYPAQIQDVKQIEGQYGPRLLWTVELTKDSYVYTARGYTATTFYEGSPEHRWASAIMGQTLQPDEEFGEAELIGAPVMARLSVRPGQNGQVFYQIDDLLPPKAGEAREPQAGTAPTTEDEDLPF